MVFLWPRRFSASDFICSVPAHAIVRYPVSFPALFDFFYHLFSCQLLVTVCGAIRDLFCLFDFRLVARRCSLFVVILISVWGLYYLSRAEREEYILCTPTE